MTYPLLALEWKDLLLAAGALLTFGTALGAAAGIAWAHFVTTRRQNVQNVATDWRQRYDAKVTELTEIKEELAEVEKELAKTERERDDFGQQLLRALARVEGHERCINRLEMALGMPLTNFNEPSQHTTNPGS